MKTEHRQPFHQFRPVFTSKDRHNINLIAASVSRYFDGTSEPRPVHLPPGASLRSCDPDPALLGVNPDLAGVE